MLELNFLVLFFFFILLLFDELKSLENLMSVYHLQCYKTNVAARMHMSIHGKHSNSNVNKTCATLQQNSSRKYSDSCPVNSEQDDHRDVYTDINNRHHCLTRSLMKYSTVVQPLLFTIP